MKTILTILLLFSLEGLLIGQQVDERLKRQALIHMRNNKLGEAIDLFNKYIAANGQNAEGYNLRGLAYFYNDIYENALFDFRRARKLDPSNPEYAQNEIMLREKWNPILYDRIEGFTREIAIDPNRAFSYLEIGKSYRWLEKWELAEQWYDEYLKRDDNASPDEVIRYTLILIETGHIVKGERILKKYVERYPEDWRLWSRYGYFTLWLNKFKTAEMAFLNALGFKPYFKEAADGLDQARKQAYVRVQHEGDLNYSEREYPIDRYYRLLKKNPDAIDNRYSLIEELVKAQRYEEAYEQLKVLRTNDPESDRYKDMWMQVMSIRENTFASKLDELLSRLKTDPTDKEAALLSADYLASLEKFDEADEILTDYLSFQPDDVDAMIVRANYLAWNKRYGDATRQLEIALEKDPTNKKAVDLISNYYASDYDYDSAIEALNKYLEQFDESQELDLRLKVARYSAWNYDWEDARDHVAVLLKDDPENLDYQLLAAQITVWTVDDPEFPTAEKYFNNVLTADEENLYALLGMATIKAWRRELPDAKYYIDLAKKFHPESKEIETTENFYNTQVLVSEDVKLLQLRTEAAEYVNKGDCNTALEKIEEFFNKTENPDFYAYMEYASINMCAGHYSAAITLYDTLLARDYNYDVALERAKAFLYNGDTLYARSEFAKLSNERPDNYYARLFLADTYLMTHEYGNAEDLYKRLLLESASDSEKVMISNRLNSIPPYGLQKSFISVVDFITPYDFRMTPNALYFDDNQMLSYYKYGSRFEAGLAKYLNVGFDYITTVLQSTDLNSVTSSQYLIGFSGILNVIFSRNFVIGGSYGELQIQKEKPNENWNIFLNYDKDLHYGINLSVSRDDARRVLYSHRLIGQRLNTTLYSASAYYNFKDIFKIELLERYIEVSDGNIGSDFKLRLAKSFRYPLTVGYEFGLSDYMNYGTLYYSPQDFQTHSAFGIWKVYYKKNWKIDVGAKLGYSPSVDFILSDLYADLSYELLNNLYVSGRISYGKSYRFDSSYKFFSTYLSIYWHFL